MQELTLHPEVRCDVVAAISAEARREGARLSVRYVLAGDLPEIALPAVRALRRVDGLWSHTCFEAFIAGPDGRYVEFNLAPSTEWAAYAFDSYREGMRPADVSPPLIEVQRGSGRFELRAELDLHGSGLGDVDWRLGLSAVVEDRYHRLCYWALAHRADKPDFHNADCFALELPASPRP